MHSTQPHRAAGEGQGANRGMTRRLGIAATAAALAFLAGCKVSVEVPEGGQVLSDQGLVCEAGETCVIDPSNTSWSESFQAVAAPGYVFTGWKQGHSFVCEGTGDCTLSTTGFAGNAQLEALLDGDVTVFVAPQFEPDPEATAADERYDVAEWQAFLATVDTPAYRSDEFLYQVAPDEGNCDPGVLTSDATGRFHSALNLIRKLHRLPAVDYDTFYDAQMQQANLVQLSNGYFTHYPQSGDTCFTDDAAAGAGSANLSWASWQTDPAWSALGWTNDNRNVSSLMAAGHRRWALQPSLGYTSYGQVRGYSSMKVFGFGAQAAYELPADLEYVAFPYRNYPHVLVTRGAYPTPWSLSMVPASGSGNYAYFDSATITVTEVASGNTLNVHSQYTDNRGFGLRNFLSWMVDDWQHDTEYVVTIGNVQTPDRGIITIEYPVEIDYEEFQ